MTSGRVTQGTAFLRRGSGQWGANGLSTFLSKLWEGGGKMKPGLCRLLPWGHVYPSSAQPPIAQEGRGCYRSMRRCITEVILSIWSFSVHQSHGGNTSVHLQERVCPLPGPQTRPDLQVVWQKESGGKWGSGGPTLRPGIPSRAQETPPPSRLGSRWGRRSSLVGILPHPGATDGIHLYLQPTKCQASSSPCALYPSTFLDHFPRSPTLSQQEVGKG